MSPSPLLTRTEFQQLATLHLRHAKALLDAAMYGRAYYLCGYVVECALKAYICKKTREFDFVHSPKIAQLAWTHDFQKLTSVSGLKTNLDEDRKNDRDLDENFAIVAGWSEDSRYEMRQQKEAADLYNAIADPAHGVLRCLEHYW